MESILPSCLEYYFLAVLFVGKNWVTSYLEGSSSEAAAAAAAAAVAVAAYVNADADGLLESV